MTTRLTREGLIERLSSEFQGAAHRLVGLECEFLGVLEESGRHAPYAGPRSVRSILDALADDKGWNRIGDEPLRELERDGTRITLEPGSQIEMSGRPHARLSDVEAELRSFIADLVEVSSRFEIRWLPLGLQPDTDPEAVAILAKPRYEIMARYLPTVGRLAPWMMRTSAGVQVNLDLEDAAEAARKLRLVLLLAPLITAIFANSPLSLGRANRWASFRGRVWLETDPDRCGIPRSLITEGSGLADYVDWALDAGMFFIERDGRLIDMTGRTFRRFMANGGHGTHALPADWDLHLTTLFPEARLKQYLEVRCCDGSTPERALAYAALATGIVYGSPESDAALTALVDSLDADAHQALHEQCLRQGLQADTPDGRPVAEICAEICAIAGSTLDALGKDDRRYLAPAEELIAAGKSPSVALLERWEGEWAHSVPRMVQSLALG